MRYETGVPIGRGASAEVFKAWDPVAKRTVALKLFPEDDYGSMTIRRNREARAQAGLDHPSICEIYEVGTTPGGRGFIAMRYVDGEPLDTVCARLPIRRRVELIVQVVEAVGMAHRAGLVHRDLKPSNVLVETQGDGSQRAFVLDFGIVRVAEETRLTETGQVLGTPGYLSPEQARGAEVDARSDVFSLGILLYQVLTDRLPFEASGVGAILQVLEHDPVPAHLTSTEVPAELGHIAQKAMEKDARRRYQDAAALQHDLERYLGGATTAARRVSLLGKWLRRAERHPRLWLTGLLLLLLAISSLIWGVANRLVVERQTRDAEIFARRATELEARARYAQLLPRHSIEPGRRTLLAEVDRLAEDVSRADGRAAAAGYYALGRAELALGRVERAGANLDRARDGGFDEPSWTLDRALALLEQTRDRLSEVELLRDPEARQAFKDRVREELRIRLRSDGYRSVGLGIGGTDGRGAENGGGVGRVLETGDLGRGDDLMIRALEALITERYVEAANLATTLIDLEPWRFEADLIVADIHREAATSTFMAEDSAATSYALDAEKDVLDAALKRAPSAPGLYRRLCENRLIRARVQLALGHPSEAWEASFAAAEAACNDAVAVLGSSLRARSMGLEVRWRRILSRLTHRGKAQELLEQAREVVAEARVLVGHPDAGYPEFQNLGNALLAEAQAHRDLGSPKPELYEEAARTLGEGLEKAPGSALGRQSLGIVWSRHGQALDAVGKDPRDSYGLAVKALSDSLNGVRAHESRVWNSICLTWNEVAYYGIRHRNVVDAGEVSEALGAAEAACGRALDLAPTYVSALSNLGLGLWTRLEWEIAAGQNPAPTFKKSKQVFGRLFERSPDHVSGRTNFAGLTAAMARFQLDRALDVEAGEAAVDPDTMRSLASDLKRARELVAPLLEGFPLDTAIQLSRLRTLEAAALCAAGETSEEAFELAEEALGRLAEDGGWQSLRHLLRAQFHGRRAECLRRSDKASTADAEARIAEDVAAGLQAIALVLEAEPSSAEAATEKRRLKGLAAALASDPLN